MRRAFSFFGAQDDITAFMAGMEAACEETNNIVFPYINFIFVE